MLNLLAVTLNVFLLKQETHRLSAQHTHISVRSMDINSGVFKCFLKVDSVFAEVTHACRLFQRQGAVTPKVRSPAVDSRDRRMTSLLDEADRSRVLKPSSAAHCKSSAKY